MHSENSSAWMAAYNGRRVLVTGHTGFKGGWLALWLRHLGARVTGFSLPPETTPAFFDVCRVGAAVNHIEGDLREFNQVVAAWQRADPDVVFHLAAQAIVRESYDQPLATIATNVLGTSHVLEAARCARRPVAVVVITSDKCYENRESRQGYVEDDRLGGHDVYSASKAAAELLTASYRRSFFPAGGDVAVATVRAGNVIGGGDWARDRIVPDIIRSLTAGHEVHVRNPAAVRPWQHVLDPLAGYLQLGAALVASDSVAYRSAWNFGPHGSDATTVGALVTRVLADWGSGAWRDVSDSAASHESTLLHLDISKASRELRWQPRWDFDRTVSETVAWYRRHLAGDDMQEFSLRQVIDYERQR